MTRPADHVLYADADVLVLDKPAGLMSHAGPSGGASLDEWLPFLMLNYRRPPLPVHRLDRDTAGCLLLGRHPKAVKRLAGLFEAGLVDKTYWAVLPAAPADDAGTIDLPLAKVKAVRGWTVKPDPAGQPAVTDWRVLSRGPGGAVIEFRPRTGRTHQLRVHAAAVFGPILGDTLYGPGPDPLHLLARSVVVPLRPEHPLQVAAPVPAALRPGFAAAGMAEDQMNAPSNGQ